MDRLQEIYKNLAPTKTFVDVGCDHGYIAKMAVDNKLANEVIISDISPKCLKKAETLLSKEIDEGLVKSVVTDGLKGIKGTEALIAGMGGEEIIKILSEAEDVPNLLVLQPMKNTDKLRLYLVEHGFRLERDYTFYDKKFYDIIVAKRGSDKLFPLEVKYGRSNLKEKGEAFIKKLKAEVVKRKKIAERDIKEDTLSMLLAEIKEMEGIINDS